MREAFWNVYRPGCLEHDVLHRLRASPNFVWELACVMEGDRRVIGQIKEKLKLPGRLPEA